jgi:hypothetical protein
MRTSKNKTILVTITIALVLILSTVSQPFGMDSLNVQRGEGLHFYSRSVVMRFLKRIGHSDYQPKSGFDIRRNATGTELRFLDVYGKKGKALVVSCNGSIKEIELPSSLVWLNDEYQALAWLSYEDWKVHYQNGQTENTPFMADERADPSGIYFMKTRTIINKDKVDSTQVYSIDTPLVPLVEIMNFLGERIFSKNDKIYVFGDYYDKRDEQTDMYVFERRDKTLIQLEKLPIRRPHKSPAPFWLIDFSPWGDEVLFSDTHDIGRSDLYVFNLKTREMKKMGKTSFAGGWSFYLQCDIIKNVTTEQEKIKGYGGK